jgi:hypothetical protein
MDGYRNDMKLLKEINPFKGYLEKKKSQLEKDGQKLNPVHEIVNNYYKINRLDGKPKNFYQGRYAYGRLATQAKRLLEHCGGNLEDALWCLDKMKYKAERGGYEWTISTCLKHDLGWGTK